MNQRALDTWILKWAQERPSHYLKIISHLAVLTELGALLTPVVAIGIQWVTALCDGAPMYALFELVWLAGQCGLFNRGCDALDPATQTMTHCILK